MQHLDLFTLISILSLALLFSSSWTIWTFTPWLVSCICVTMWALVLRVGDQSAKISQLLFPPSSTVQPHWPIIKPKNNIYGTCNFPAVHLICFDYSNSSRVLCCGTTLEFTHLTITIILKSLRRSIWFVMSINHQATPLLVLSVLRYLLKWVKLKL